MEIAEVCRRVPEFPARNFREALQSFWFTHCCIQIEQCGCGHSLGRFTASICIRSTRRIWMRGTLAKEQVLTLLKCQWVKASRNRRVPGRCLRQGFFRAYGAARFSLGGYTADGDDASNDLEELLMDTQIAMNNIQPTLALFYTPKMKPSYLEKAAEVVRSGSGQPQFMNMNAAVARSLVRFRFPRHHAGRGTHASGHLRLRRHRHTGQGLLRDLRRPAQPGQVGGIRHVRRVRPSHPQTGFPQCGGPAEECATFEETLLTPCSGTWTMPTTPSADQRPRQQYARTDRPQHLPFLPA